MLRLLLVCAVLLAPVAGRAFCPADCDGSERVWVDELLRGVGIALGRDAVQRCAPADLDGDGAVTIDELTRAVRVALAGCTVDDLVFRGVSRPADGAFATLPDYPFAPHYLQVGALRVHYVDEGPRDAAPVLLLHGVPSWSYLYRHVIPPLVAAGHRVVAPDLVGFGRSDKPLARQEYTAQRLVDWTRRVVEQLDLRDLTLVLHDWGGPIGLRLAAADPQRYARLVVTNTGLATGDEPLNEALLAFRDLTQSLPILPISVFLQLGSARQLSAAELAAYDAPFPDEGAKAGARQLPILIPDQPDAPGAAANRAAWEALRHWRKPFLTAFSDGDAITGGGERRFQTDIPGAAGQPHTTIRGAGHFLQEDAPQELAAVIAAFIAATSAP